MTQYRHAALAAALSLALSATVSRAALWVSSGGDDANPGTEERPLRTIARARDVVRTMNRDMADDITVFIGGVHRLSAPVEFGPEDSATNGFSIVYTAAPGEHPVISGAMPVAGWTCADRARNLWSAPAPQGLEDCGDLFVDGSRAERTRARLPQVPANAPEGTPAGPRPQFRNPGDVVYSPAGADAVWSERAGTPPLYAENAFELLGRPGEWYLDRPARRFYYTPRPGEDLAAADVEAAVAPALISGSGRKHLPLTGLVFKGLRFEYAAPAPADAAQAPGVVRFSLAGSVQVLEDAFVHMSAPALELGPGVEGASVEGCILGDISSGALRIAWSSQVRVAESRFSYVCTSHPESAALAIGHSGDVEVEHNQIDHFPGAAIAADGMAPGSSAVGLNLLAPPMVAFDAGPPPQGPAAQDGAAAGVTSAYQAVLGERVIPPSAPHPPAGVSAEAEDGFAYVTWDPPCLDGGSDVSAYSVTASSGAAITVAAAEFRSRGYAVLGGLENGRAVSFAVAAVNANGSSQPSLPSAAVVPGHKRRLKAPQQPASASITPGAGSTTVRLAPPAAPAASPVIAYSLTVLPSGPRLVLEGRDVIRADAAHPVARTLPGFTPGPGAAVAVCAINAKGPGAPLEVRLRQ